MTIALAVAWRPSENGVKRFEALRPLIDDLYCGMSIVVPPNTDADLIARLRPYPMVKVRVGKQMRENRRYYTLQQALEFTDADFIHYCDGDHVISRLERDPDDWRRGLDAMQNTDCLIIGRSAVVFETYPRTLVETEKIINLVASYLLGQNVDLGSGSRGLSRRAVEFLMQYASPETHGVATDSEWVVLLHRAGYDIKTYESDTAIYEVLTEAQRDFLESAEQWSKRVQIAHMIIDAGLAASVRDDLPKLM